MARPRIYTFNEQYFDTIDSFNKAYILGFIYADGSVRERGGLDIALSEKDIEVLEFIKKELEYTGNIKIYEIKGRNYCRLSITSKKLAISLIKLGVIENKTYKSSSFPTISEKYFNSFLRGFFDGDGSISKSKNKSFTVSFSSNRNILTIVKNYLKSLHIKTGEIRLRHKNSEFSGMLEMRGSSQIEKLKAILYKDEGFYLERKFNIFQEAENYYKTLNRPYIKEKISIIKDYYLSGLTQKEIHLKLDIPFSSVRGVIQRLRKNKEII